MVDRKLRPSSFDYALAALAPVLIILMIGSLVYFLITTLYRGDFHARLMWILGLFTMASVLVTRIAIEQSRAQSLTYLGLLSAATLFVAPRFFVLEGLLAPLSIPILIGFLALIVFLADRITMDSTSVEDAQDSHGYGLLQSLGILKRTDLTGPDSSKTEITNKNARAHNPGVWILYFALGALPVFGLGQFFLPSGQPQRVALGCLVIYLSSALALLVMISLLALRQYVRQRDVEMGSGMSFQWLTTGIGSVLGLVILMAILPLPMLGSSTWELPFKLSSRDDQTPSRWGWGNEQVKQLQGSQPQASQPQGSQPQGSQPQGSQPQGSQPQASQPQASQPQASQPQGNQQQGSQPQGSQPQGSQPQGSQPQASQPQGSQPQASQPQGNQQQASQPQGSQPQASQQQGNQPQASQQQGNQQQGNQPQGSQPQASQQQGNQQQGNQQQGNQQQGNQPQGSQPQASQPQGNQQQASQPQASQPQGNQPQGSQPQGNQPQGSQPQGSQPQGSQQQGSQPQGSQQQGNQPQGNQQQGNQQQPPQASNSTWKPPSMDWNLGATMRWLLIGVLALVALVFGVKYLREFLAWFQGAGSDSPRADGDVSSIVDTQKSVGFRELEDPFQRHRNDPDAIVRALFHAVSIWGREHRVARGEDETPDEYSRRLGRKYSEVAEPLTQLGLMVSRLAYAKKSISIHDAQSLRSLWDWMRTGSD